MPSAASCCAFPASRNLAGNCWIYFLFRRLAEIARTVPEIVYALIFVVAFGIGPFAGFLALTLHTVGAMGKLYAEANENIDERQLEGVRASGGNWFEVIRFAVLPQVLPNFTTYTLWRLELNIRSAAIVGFVGAGGIGQELYHAISFNYYEDVSAIVLMVVATIMVIDLICEKAAPPPHRQGKPAMSLSAGSIDPAQLAALRQRYPRAFCANTIAARRCWPRFCSACSPSSCSASTASTPRRRGSSTASIASARSPARCSRRRRAMRSGIWCGPCWRASAWRFSAR